MGTAAEDFGSQGPIEAQRQGLPVSGEGVLSETDKPDVGRLSSHHTDKSQEHREVGTN